MSKQSEISFEKMKTNIRDAGNLFYQYRPCRRDASTIYDIENIRHGQVYARTPLQMNDPFDSMIGFSAEKIYDECIELIFTQVKLSLDENVKLISLGLLINSKNIFLRRVQLHMLYQLIYHNLLLTM